MISIRTNINRYILLILLFFFPILLCNAQASNAMELSDNLYNLISQQGIEVKKNYLTGVNPSQFPYSISITINTNDIENNEKNLIISVPQEMAIEMTEELIGYIHKLNSTTLPVTVTLLLVADDFSRLPNKYTGQYPYGTISFLSNRIEAENTAAILISPNTSENNSKIDVIFGTEGRLTPQWLLQQIPLPFSQNSLLTYRLNLSEPNKRLKAFFDKGIAALVLQLDSKQKEQTQNLFFALEQVSMNFNIPENSYANNTNYIFFSMPNSKKIWISERLFIFIYLIIAAAVLLFATGFSVLKRHSLEKQKVLARTWFIIPVTILFTTLSLQVGQIIAINLPNIIKDSPIAILSIKTFISFLIVSTILIILTHFRLPLSQVIYGYLLTLVSVMNIFIFASIDLILLAVFIFEYILIYFARLTRKTIPLFISTFVMLIPFIPYAINIWEYASSQNLFNLVNTSFFGNLLYACILVPFQIMWLRIFIRMNIFGKNKNLTKTKIYGTSGILLFTFLCVIVGGFIVISSLYSKSKITTEISKINFYTPIQVIEEDKNHPLPVSIEVNKSNFLETGFVRLTVESKLPVLKYDVTVTSERYNPVYDSYAPFSLSQNKNIRQSFFSLPYNPAMTSSLSYTSLANDEQEILVKIFVQNTEKEATMVIRKAYVLGNN